MNHSDPKPNTNPLEFKSFRDNRQFIKWQEGKAATIHQVTPVVVDSKVHLNVVFQENM